jgi:hypothetical protein
MKVNFNAKLNDLHGQPMHFAENGKAVPMLLKHAAVEALLGQSNSLPDGEAKFKAYQMAERIMNAKGAVDMTPEDVTELKTKIGTQWGANVVGPSYKLLNG